MGLKIIDHPEEDFIEIEGIKYHYSFFKDFDVDGPPVGSIMRIERREGGVIAVSRLSEEPNRETRGPQA